MSARAFVGLFILALAAATSITSAQALRVSFGVPSSMDSGGIDPAGRAVGDFNQDGHPDLLVTSTATGANVNLFTGDASGSPSHTGGFVFLAATAVAAADFNGDGVLDAVVTQDVTSKTDPSADSVCGAPIGIGVFLGPDCPRRVAWRRFLERLPCRRETSTATAARTSR